MTVQQERTPQASPIEAEIAGGRLPTTRPPAPTDLLDKDRYLSREFADAELAKMWSKVWQIACLDSDVPNVGDYYEYKIGRESILVVRESDDGPGHSGVKAYHNVCQHRGRPLKQGCGNAEKLQCPYHGWTWNLDGSLRHVPERQEFCPFSDESVALPPVKIDRWEQFYFVNLDPDAGPLADYLGDIPRRVAAYKLSGQYKWWSRSTIVPVNWKIALDAFQEDYHARYIHPETNSFADYTDNPIELIGDHSMLAARFGVPDRLLEQIPDMAETLDAMEWTFQAFGEDTALIAALRGMNLPDGTMLHDLLPPIISAGMAQAGVDISGLTETQLVDDYEWFIFPNIQIHTLAFGSWFFRMRPNGTDPASMIFDMWFLHKVPEAPDGHCVKPPAAENIHVETGGSCGAVMDQDFNNIVVQQQGLHSSGFQGFRLSAMETRISHFHETLDRYLES
jgi:phenylpropionate dioxygenase-like ring-hydroxylating dioxygenase large terminal subunit